MKIVQSYVIGKVVGYLPIIRSWAGLLSLVPARFLALQLNQPPSDLSTLWITRFPPPATPRSDLAMMDITPPRSFKQIMR